MGKIYKISKSVGGTFGYHDYLLYQKDDGTVRILRGGPDLHYEAASPLGRIKAVEQAYYDNPDVPDYNPLAFDPATGQWDTALETRPMVLVYDGADVDTRWNVMTQFSLNCIAVAISYSAAAVKRRFHIGGCGAGRPVSASQLARNCSIDGP